MVDKINPRANRLLSALPEESFERISPALELESLALSRVLHEPGERLSHVYFPVDAIVSLIYELEDGFTSEVAVVGNDGMIGVAVFLGGGSVPSRGIVQSGGSAYRMSREAAQREFVRYGDLHHILMRYTQALLTQIAQTVVCNRHHSVEQQFCRWLLLSLDRLTTQELSMTQELIASMLGVRREGVTEAAGRLQKRGLIKYRRGRIQVHDRAGIEALSCECYAAMKREADRLSSLPKKHSSESDE